MAPLTTTWRSADDEEFLDNVKARDLKAFRDSIFPKPFVESNPTIFLGMDWVDVPKLKAFLRDHSLAVGNIPSTEDISTIKPEPSDTPIIKNELCDSDLARFPASNRLRTRQLHEDGHAVIEILSSDSDSESNQGVHKDDLDMEKDSGGLSEWESDSYLMDNLLPPVSEAEGFGSEASSGINDEDSDDSSDAEKEFDASVFIIPSDTIWDDPDVTSTVITHKTRITTSLTVQRLEYLTEIPSLWPIPRIPTAFILDLRDPKFRIVDKDGKLFSPDALIKNKDQDSWRGGTGTADSTAQVVFAPGTSSVTCRRSRLTCQGCHVCSEVDCELVDIARYELDPSLRDKIFAAQRKTRQEDGNSALKRTVTFYHVVQSRPQCDARDDSGKRCEGRPMMKEQPPNSTSRCRYWIACSGWTTSFKSNHRTTTIPDDVDEDILAKLMAGKAISDDSDLDTAPCSRVVPPNIGGKLKYCPHPHIVNGKTQSRALINHRRCPAQRTIYVPVDPEFRIALVVHPKMLPHNHPMPPKSKVSIEAKTAYRGCIEAITAPGMTVQKVDNSPSTKLLLGGKTPGEHNPALQDKRVKRSILRQVKLEKHPSGLGLPGIMHLHIEDLSKPMNQRYIHKVVTSDDGGVLVFTFVPSLLALIHKEEVTAFECDVTFKRAIELNEWEMVIYLPSILRTVTIARVYTNRATTDHFVLLFNELQRLTELHTGHQIRFKRFTPGGNLLVMNADMEAAQILAAGIAFLPMNDVNYSKIDTQVPEEFVQYFVRVCLTHSKRIYSAVLDFKSLVSARDFQRLISFPYLKSQEELDKFTQFIKDLKIKKIHDWWAHKIQSKWIIPCILKSKSRILPEHWDITPATTNMGEAQHHWTNKQSGIKLPDVEAVLSAKEIDLRVDEEIKLAYKTGIVGDKQTELFHRTSRKAQRHTATARKARDATQLHLLNQDIRKKIDDEKAKRKESMQIQQKLQEELNVANGKPLKSVRAPITSSFSQADASSSGRVKSTPYSKEHSRTNDTSTSDPEPDESLIPYSSPHSPPHPPFPEPTDDSNVSLSLTQTTQGGALKSPAPSTLMTLDMPSQPLPEIPSLESDIPLPSPLTPGSYPPIQLDEPTLDDPNASMTDLLGFDFGPQYPTITGSDYSLGAFNFQNFDATYWSSEPVARFDMPLMFEGIPNTLVETSNEDSGPLDEYGIPVRFLPTPAPSSSPTSSSVHLTEPQPPAPKVVEDEAKKRPRDEIDVRAILPEGSKRVKVKSARARGMEM